MPKKASIKTLYNHPSDMEPLLPGEDAGNLKDFVADLEAQGFVKKRGSEGWRWHGIQLIENASKINGSVP